MKKRVLSALLVLCMACSMVSTVWANQATPETADKPASVLLDDSQSAPVTNAPAQDQDVAEGLTAPEDEESGQQSDVDTPDASQPEQAESTGTPVGGGVEYTAALEQDGQVLNVIVTAPEGAFDEGMEPKLSVSAIEDEAQTDGIAAKLDEYGLTYDGFAALDISFKNEAGEEIEPKVPVTVRIELPQAIVDSGIDLNTLAVQHLEEDENGDVKNVTEVATLDNGITLSEEAAAAANEAAGVAPMSDMPAEEATAGDASETPAAVAEFDVDGFSSFVITWVNYDDGRNTASLKVVIRNADTHQEMNIPGLDVSEWNEYLGDNTTITVEQLVNSLNTGNYEFQYATYYTAQNRNEQEFWSVRALRSDVQGDGSIKPRYHFYFNGSNDYVRVTKSDATVYLYYKENEPGGSGGDQGGTGTTSTTVTTGKSAVKIDGTNNYTLNLSVSGDRGSQTQKQAVDVLFIIDRSASMEKSLGGWQTKIGAVKSAVSTLVNSINDPQDSIEVRYSAIRFSNASGTQTVGNGWYSENNASNFINQINAITTNEGTNWEAGIHKAIETLDGSDRPNATKIVVFLSDGVPTYSGGFNGESEHGDGSDHASSYYGQSEKTISGFADDAAKEIEKLDCDYFFAIGIGSDFNLGNRGRTYMTRLTDHVQAGIPTRVLSANNETDLESAFNMIEEATRFFAANNVVMVDQMSDYADLVPVNGGSNNGQYEFTLALEKKASAEEDYLPVQGASQTVYVTANSNQGTTVTLQDGTEQVPITVFVDKDKDDSTGKETIRVVFGKTSDGKLYELAQNYRYTVSTVITPSQKAITEGKDQYNGEGEANTGTHAGADGFWSNDNDNALVNYNAITTDENGNITDSTPGTPVYFPKPVIQVPEKTTVNLTLEKTFAGLTDEDVYFLLFGQYALPKNPTEDELDDYYNANFSFDVNFCDTSMKNEGGDDDHWMVKDEPGYSEISLEEFTKPGTDEKVTTGDHFKVYAAKCLDNPESAAQLDQASNPGKGATLTKNDQGDWVYTQTIEIPVTPDNSATEDEKGYRYFYTVYELHGEVPGYAKLDPDSAEYTVQLNKQSNGAYEHTWTGLGKFVQANTDYSNIDRANALVNMTNEDEQNGISQNELARLHITSDTTISFINYYTDSLSIQKEVTENDATPSDELLSELDNKEYTIKIAPADAGKLVTSSSTEAKNGLGPNWAEKLDGKSVTVERTNAEGGRHTDQVTFNDQGEIILKLYRGEKVTLKDIPAINYRITEITPDGKDSTFYDTTNYYLADTLFTEDYSNQKVDNGPEDMQYGSGGACTEPGKNNMGPDHWNQYSANDSYGYDDAAAASKTQDGVVSVDVDISKQDKTSVDVVLTNDYEHFKTVTITKHVGGEMGAKDTAFNFTTEVSRQKDSVTYSADVTKQTVSDGKMTLTGAGSSTEVVDVTVGNAVLTDDGYQLSHGDVLTIDKLKKGDTITIVENEANQNGYDSTYTINETGEKNSINGAITVTLDDTALSGDKDNDHMIPVDVYNDRPVVTPTGLESNHTTPYTLMVTAAGIAGLALIGGIVVRRRRRRME